MNDRQHAFVTAFLRTGDPEAAARVAGYTDRGARRTGYRLIRDPEVRAEIRRLAPPPENLTPLEYLQRVMRDPAVPLRRRIRVAIALAPYFHERRGK